MINMADSNLQFYYKMFYYKSYEIKLSFQGFLFLMKRYVNNNWLHLNDKEEASKKLVTRVEFIPIKMHK